MSGYPQVILALGNVPAPPDAIVIDYRSGSIWRNGECLVAQVSGRATLGFAIVAMVLAHGPGGMPYACLIEALWGDDQNGGSIDPRGYIQTVLAKWRPVLEEIGIATKSIRRGLDVRFFPPDEMAAIIAERVAFSAECRERFKGRRDWRGRPRKLMAA